MLIVANVINLILAVLLVYGPGDAPPVFAWGPPVAEAFGLPRLELMGAAWATVLSRGIALIPTTWIIIRRFGLFGQHGRGPLIPAEIRRIWAIGWPTSIQLVVRILALLVTHSLVARAYTTATDQSATTALGIVFRLETMALFVGLGWGSASQTFVGQNLGAKQPERAARAGWLAMLYNAGLMALLVWAYTTWAAEIIGFFDKAPSVLNTGVEYLDWVGPSYVGLGIGIVLGSAMQGAGATRLALAIDLVVILLFQVPASLLVVFGFGWHPVRLWQVLAATYVAYAVVYTLSYRRGGFLRVRMN
jgi:Na+-driven multidrug efflux pump